MWRLMLMIEANSVIILFFLEKVYFIGCTFDVKLQADNLVRWDVAERLNHKQIIQKSETLWHTNTSPKNGRVQKKASSKNSIANVSYNGESNHQRCVLRIQPVSTKHVNSAIKLNKAL